MKPENEIIFAVLDEKQANNGDIFYSGFLGPNTIKASLYNGKLYLRLQKWPKKDIQAPSIQPKYNPNNEEDVPF
jgi:hypothetical protein